MSAGGESLSKHLYDAAGGDVKTAAIQLNGDTTWETIVTPASGKGICILCLIIMPSAGNTATDLSFWSGTTEVVIVDNFGMAYIAPQVIDVSECPIIGTADYLLRGRAPAANPTTVYVNYLELS